MPLKGADGFGRPAIGLPTKVDIDFAGRRVRRGASVRLVGTWPLKGVFYSDLRKNGVRAGAEVDPPGYCHFPSWLDDLYFRQITSEYLAEEIFKGRPRKFWKLRGGQRDNHFLDCRAYNLALLEYLGFSKLTADDWRELARERGAPAGEELEPLRSVTRAGSSAPAALMLPSDGAAEPSPTNPFSEAEIERARRAIETVRAGDARAWPPRRNA